MPRYGLNRYGTFRYGDYPLRGSRAKMELAPGLRMRHIKSPVWLRSEKIVADGLFETVRMRAEDGEWVEARTVILEGKWNKVRVRDVGGKWVVGVVQRLEERT